MYWFDLGAETCAAQERVEKAGGQVLYWNGHRVMGVLAMSRAIGDHGLRPYIIPEPEVRCMQGCELICSMRSAFFPSVCEQVC